MKILFIGDIIGRPGRNMTKQLLPEIKKEFSPDVIIANGENSAAGFGITAKVYKELTEMGIEVITMGNHIWDRKEFLSDIGSCPNLIRPANYPEGVPGIGYKVFTANNGTKYAVLNLIGRVFMTAVDDPFKVGEKIINKLRKETHLVIVDMHAEATSEKQAISWFLDGKATALIGTHTHVQTADERILPGGTAMITDIGMVGSWDSIIGVEKDNIINRFLTAMPTKFEPEKNGKGIFNALLIEADPKTGKTIKLERIFKVINEIEQEAR
ncbi:TIGR00282 family metallophosphoesterase [Candidatus Margulisiibacteriota bacterium]